MGQKKVVLDTNTIISAFGWGGNPKAIIDLALENKLSLITSPPQMDELRRVLAYPKLHLTGREKEHILDVVSKIARIVNPKTKVAAIIDDPADNRIIEAAIDGGADYIITGDKHLLELREYNSIRIVTSSEFLNQQR